MFSRKLKYRLGGWYNYRIGYWFKFPESKAESIFYDIALLQGFKLTKQYRFTKHLPVLTRLKVFLFPFLHKSYRCDFRYKKYIIEIDSPYHNKIYDSKRDLFMNRYGFIIIRIDCKLLYKKKGLSEVQKVLKSIKSS